MPWEVFVMCLMFVIVCTLAIVGAYWFAERSVRLIRRAWARAQRVQDDAWDRMNKERTIWIQKLNALVAHNLRLTELNGNSARREIEEVQRYMEATRQDIIKDVARTVGDKLAQYYIDEPRGDETTRFSSLDFPGRLGSDVEEQEKSLDTAVREREFRVTPSNA